jgi:hypothetical protein
MTDLGHCPSADNPRTQVVETDCSMAVNVNNQTLGHDNAKIGRKGNLCQVDCANQGICDYSTGTCRCFEGRYGIACTNSIVQESESYHPDGIYAEGSVSLVSAADSNQYDPHLYFTTHWDTATESLT